MAYPTTAELVAASTVPELTTLTAPQQAAHRTEAINAIERFTGQRFEAEEVTEAIDGTGGREVWLPRRLEEMTAIEVRGTSHDLSDVTLSAKGDRLYFADFDTSYAVMAMRDQATDSRTFRAGPGSILLTGTWGWSVCPEPVADAIRIEMEEQARADASALAPIISAARRLGYKTISQGNLRAEVGKPEDVSLRAARLLSGYVWLGPAGYLAA